MEPLNLLFVFEQCSVNALAIGHFTYKVKAVCSFDAFRE